MYRNRKRKQDSLLRQIVFGKYANLFMIFVVSAYIIAGAFIIRSIEIEGIIARLDAKVKRSKEITVERNIMQTKILKTRSLEEGEAMVRFLLREYQKNVSIAVNEVGYDGNEVKQTDPVKWHISSTALYTLTLLTMIGYGHIYPVTNLGMIFTMVYSLIGIPLTLLLLSNLGEALATGTKRLYMKRCCGGFHRIRRKTWHSHPEKLGQIKQQLQQLRDKEQEKLFGKMEEAKAKKERPLKPKKHNSTVRSSCSSRISTVNDVVSTKRNSVLNQSVCNSHTVHMKTSHYQTVDFELTPVEIAETSESQQSPKKESHHRIGGLVHVEESVANPPGSVRSQRSPSITSQFSHYDDDFDLDELCPEEREVPIVLAISLIVVYLFFGLTMFSKWENWTPVQAAYFSFITLTTIGLGDLVPSTSVKSQMAQIKLVLASIYIITGLAILSTAFNLMIETATRKGSKSEAVKAAEARAELLNPKTIRDHHDC